MLGGFHGSGIFTVTKYRPISVLLRILAALVLALVLVGANQLPLAHAASDNSTEVSFELQVNPAHPAPICLHHSQKFYIFLTRHLSLPQYGIPDLPLEISGVVVRGSVADTNIGTLLPSDTSGSSELSDLSIGTADFSFLAKKAGTTILKFDAEVGSYWDGDEAAHTVSQPHPVHVEVPVKVIPCKFKVNTIQQSVVAGGGNFNIVATIDSAEMTADEQGHFTGTSPVNWVGAASNVGVCFASIKVAPITQANLTGDIDESGQLSGNLTVQAPETTTTANCYGVSVTEPTPLSADPLSFSIPASGGVVTVSQGFMFNAGLKAGSAVIVVTPEEDQAAAFHPNNHGASWDYFSSLFGALLALR